MHYKIANLELSSPYKTNSINEVFIAEPDLQLESLAGRLFIIVNIDYPKKSESLKFFNFLIDFVNKNYYQNEKILLREKVTNLKVEHIFESVIAKTNKELINFIKNEKIKIPNKDLNITIGIVYEDQIIISSTGTNKNFLIYKKPKDGEDDIYKLTEITNETNGEILEEQKIFTNVLNGQIPESSYFLITNEALPEYISKKEIISIITTLPPLSAVEQLKNKLGEINSYVAFSSIIIKNTKFIKEDYKSKAKYEENRSPKESINTLNRTEEDTEKLLSPTGSFSFTKYFKLPFIFLTAIKDKHKSQKNKAIFIKGNASLNPIKIKLKFSKILKPIKVISIGLINSFFFIIKSFSKKEHIVNLFYKIKKGSSSFFRTIISWFNSVNKQYKILSLAIIISIAIFSLATANKNKENKIVENNNKYDEITKQIEIKQNQADANLLFKNKEGAMKLFNEIESLLSQIATDTPEKINQYNKFNDKFNDQLEKLQNFINIKSPIEIVNLSNINHGAQPINLITNNNRIYIGDPANKSIYITNIETDITTTLTDINIDFSEIKNPLVDSNNTIYWLNNDKLITLNENDENLNELSINSPNISITDYALYNGRLYILSSENNQIYRLVRKGSVYGSATRWITEEINIEDGIGIAIDGLIYTLHKDGSILKFLRGKEQKLSIDPIEPSLENPSKIEISPAEGDKMYVLEKEKNRIIVFTKDGEFLYQYKSDVLNDIKDFVVDEEANVIYVLNSNSVYSFEMESIEN